MTLEQADEIRMKYGIFLEQVAPVLIKYFRGQIPESLLPADKDEIAEAVEMVANYYEDANEPETASALRNATSFLVMCGDDAAALQKAAENFSNPAFKKVYLENR